MSDDPERREAARLHLIDLIAENGAAVPDIAKTEAWALDRLKIIGECIAHSWDEYKTVAASAGITVRGLNHCYEPAAGEPTVSTDDPSLSGGPVKRAYFSAPAMGWGWSDACRDREAALNDQPAALLRRFAEGGPPPRHPEGPATSLEIETDHMRRLAAPTTPSTPPLPPPPRPVATQAVTR